MTHVCMKPDCQKSLEAVRLNKRFCSVECKKEHERRVRLASKVYNEILRNGFISPNTFCKVPCGRPE